jgi:hypothetical protein
MYSVWKVYFYFVACIENLIKIIELDEVLVLYRKFHILYLTVLETAFR